MAADALVVAAGAAAILLLLLVFLGFVKYKPRDWRFLFNGLRLKLFFAKGVRRNAITSTVWSEAMKRKGRDADCMVFGDDVWSYGRVDAYSNRMARLLHERGVKAGETIALYMSNRPEYVCVWLGATKMGARTALINHNLKTDALVHSLIVSGARLLVFEAWLAENVGEVSEVLRRQVPHLELLACDAPVGFAENLDAALAAMRADPLPPAQSAEKQGVLLKDPFLYVYTSGTTGLPKAAIVTHARFRNFGSGFLFFSDISPKDRLFCALPLYHSAGGLIGVGLMFFGGVTLIINHRNHGRFSASNFWSDCQRHRATVIQYIGEVCRYLVAQAASPHDREHRVRLAIGNGLRPEVWSEFQSRFGVARVLEFYGATEGASALLNTEGRVGAVGFISPLIQFAFPMTLVRFNHETEQPIRNARGFCERCAPGEAGEFIAEIRVDHGISNFSGYKDEKANAKKIMENVFRKGDRWFRSGDLLRQDPEGFLYFVDRIGDTFRWKGENVSTFEVATILSKFSEDAREPNVYGVEVKGHDGRAGMVCFASSSKRLRPEHLDLPRLARYVVTNLPTYARPLFLRVSPEEMEVTGTFKHRKVALVAEGFDPSVVKDPLFFLQGEEYVPLTPAVYFGICSGQIRV